MIQFPKELTDILSILNAQGFEAYFVGGCVRDKLLGIETFDIDINTNASTEIMSKLFLDYSPMIYENFGNVKFKLGPYKIDITRFRKEGKYKKNRYPTAISFDASLKDDLLRRDFTINALIYHPNHGIGDLVGGLKSLKKRKLKTIGNPYLKLNEDHLRMLRLIRFAAKLDFEIDPHAFQILKEHYYRVASLGLGQIENEFLGFLDAPHFEKIALKYPWALTSIISEMAKAEGFGQNNVFHRYDLFEHTVHTIVNCDSLELKIAALFHDIGKLKTKVVNEDGSFSFPKHATESLKIMTHYFSQWILVGLDKDTIRKLVLLHDISIPLDYVEMKKLVHLNGPDFMRKLVAFKRADNLAKSEKAAYQIEKCDLYDELLDRIEQDQPALKLEDLSLSMDEVFLEGELKGAIFNKLMDLVIEEKIENTKEALLKEVDRLRHELY